MTIRAQRWIDVPLTVALNTDPPGFPGCQQEAVRGAMGNMTTAAPLHFHSLMLKNPGTSLLRMALKAYIVIKLIPFPQTGPRPGPVRCVTV
jgi:hypothetical protein